MAARIFRSLSRYWYYLQSAAVRSTADSLSVRHGGCILSESRRAQRRTVFDLGLVRLPVGQATSGRRRPKSHIRSVRLPLFVLFVRSVSEYERAMRPFPSTNCEGWVAVVDDDASIRQALARVLSVSGIRVRTFGSAEHYLAQVGPEEPSCLILDVHLPGRNGFALRDELEARGSAAPIIFISALD